MNTPARTLADRVLDEIRALLIELRVGDLERLRWSSRLAEQFGLDSLSTLELQDRLEHAFDVRLPAEVLDQARTPDDWLRAVRGALGEATAAPADRAGQERTALPEPRTPGTPWASEAATLTAALGWHAQRHPDLVGLRVLGEGSEGAVDDLTYGALEADASVCAQSLLSEGLGHGERVAIMLPTGRDYFVVSMAVMLAGGVPVPIYPPAQLAFLEEHLRRQALLLSNARSVALVTVPEAMLAARLLRTQVPTLRSIRTPTMLRAASVFSRGLPTVTEDDVALIQYTSGSTGDPKGVVLTHAQLLANIRAMGEAAQVDSTDVFVSWLPLYHDMGLIGAWHAASLYFGMLTVVMSPLRFLARPADWLATITRYSGTLSAAPNFAYQLCVDRIRDEELATLDLSSLRLTFNGSEPVNAHTAQSFCRRFASAGFQSGSMCPAYGLAEVGVGLTFTSPGRGIRVDSVLARDLERGHAISVRGEEPGSLQFVSNGRPLPGYEIRVVDEVGRPRPERCPGTIECRGPSTTTGYFDNDEANQALYRDGWLDTGDEGYMADGELYVTGRVKDVVVRAGRNLHPEELEQGLGQLPGLNPDAMAVFGVGDPSRGTERIVVSAETSKLDPAEEAELRTTVARRSVELIGVRPDEIVFLPAGSLPRTPSAKVRRGATRDAYVAGTLGRPPSSATVQLGRFALSGLAPALARFRHQAGALLYAIRVWVAVVAIGVPTWLVLLLPSSRARRWRIARHAGRMLQAAAGIDLEFDFEGSFSDPSNAPVIVANHPSFIDGLVLLLASDAPLTFVSSTDFERQLVAGTTLRRLGCVFVHRGRPGQTAADLGRLVALVGAGEPLVVFPEGSMTMAEGVGRFHLGAFAVAASAQCPVVPVGISGTRRVVRPGHFLPHRAPVSVRVGEPLQPTSDAFAAIADMAEEARHMVAELADEPLLG